MMIDKTEPAGGASRLHAELEELRHEIAHLHCLNGLLRSDAERYRWLIDRLQKAYDGNDLEIGDMIVGCSMIYARRNERRVSGAIHWSDERDEPLNLSAAIDAAMAESSNAQVTGRPPAECGESNEIGEHDER